MIAPTLSRLLTAVGLGVVLWAGCGDAPAEPRATLDSLQAHVFAPACVDGCHESPGPAGDLDLSTAEASYSGLVDVPARNAVAAENRWLRVRPGDPGRSFLMRKLELPGFGEGAPMPVGDQAITADYLDLLRTWIAEGAPR